MEPEPTTSLVVSPPPPPLLAMSDLDPDPGPHSPRPLMDLDLYIDASPWTPFDPSAFVASSPLLLSSSSPSPPTLVFPPPPSPLWPFEDRVLDISAAAPPRFANGDSATIKPETDAVDSTGRLLQVTGQEEKLDAPCVIKERISLALRYFKESTDQHVLVQVWAPVKDGHRSVLTTSGQPFVLHPMSTKLLHYRTASQMYIFSADEDDDAYLGIPGRVFTKRMPEWTPNVQYYNSTEYQRLNHALLYDVQGTLALPVFEPLGQSCIAVVELVMTSQKINYAYDVDKVCKALEAVNLKSSDILDHPNVLIANDGRQAALAEILEILTVVCEARKLPLAQTWVPCRHRTVLAQGGGLKKICSSFDGSCMGQVCMSTTDVAFYVVDAHLWGFRDACAEHHLQKGQGAAGRAFALRRPYFCRDITKYCKSQYPLVHYAKMFGLVGCLAICLRSVHSGDDDYILEFFLPADCKNLAEQQELLKSISVLLKQFLQNLKVITDVEFQEGISLELVDLVTDDNYELQPGRLPSPRSDTQIFVSSGTKMCEVEAKDDSPSDSHGNQNLHEQLAAADPNVRNDGNLISDSPSLSIKTSKTPGKRRGKAEKMISLEVLQQYFSGSLKDAAKSLGVCPTTMKRICRHHGISRWPSRKINKVNRSLSKLKHVIESVQGSGALDLTSLAGPLPVTVDPLPVNLDGLKGINDGEKRKEFMQKSRDVDDQPKRSASLPIQVDDVVPQLQCGKDSRCSKTGSSSEDSMDAPTSHGSCQGSPVHNDLLTSHHQNLSDSRQEALDTGSSKMKLPNACNQNMPSEDLPSAQAPVGVLIKDSGSSKDLKNLCTSGGEAPPDERTVVLTGSDSKPWAMQESRAIVIKANYKDDVIRFRLPCGASLLALKEEISKRLKLEVGIFDIKYLDDDHEWVMLACDSDLEECMEIARLSGAHIIRLSVHDIMHNLGSSCESSEFDHHNYAARQFNVS